MSTCTIKKVTNGYVVTVFNTSITGVLPYGYDHPAEHVFKTKKEMFDWLEATLS